MVQYSTARDCAAGTFNVKHVKTDHGVKFFIKFEQTCKIVEFKPKEIMIKLISKFIENGWSMKSAIKMQSKYGGLVRNGDGLEVLELNTKLGMAIQE